MIICVVVLALCNGSQDVLAVVGVEVGVEVGAATLSVGVL